MEEAVDCHREAMAHARDGAEGVGARTQVGDIAQVLERMLLRRDRVGVGIVHESVHFDLGGLQFNRLPLALARDHNAADLNRAASGELEHLGLVVRNGVGDDRLHGVEAGAIGDGDEGNAGLRVTASADPTLDRDGGAEVGGVVGEEVGDADGGDQHGTGKIGDGNPEGNRAPISVDWRKTARGSVPTWQTRDAARRGLAKCRAGR